MFKQRLLSGIILVAITLVLFILGGYPLWIAMIIVSCIGMHELNRVFGVEKTPVGWVSYLACAIFYFNLRTNIIPDIMLFVSGFVIALLFVYVISFPKYKADQVMAAFFSFFYVALMLSYVYQTRMLENGKYFVWLILICSWGCDTCAYCVGVLIGKHKMAPVLSPKKSIEGAVGGVVGAMLLAFLFCTIFKNAMHLPDHVPMVVGGITGCGALISMVGDLAASAIKRNYDIKDYGTLIPGHGGILDRFDSVIITAPIIFYMLKLGLHL